MFRLAPCIILTTLLPLSLSASQEGVDQAVTAAEHYLNEILADARQPSRVAIRHPDRRLTLSTCAEAPQANANVPLSRMGKINVKVSCEGPLQWSIYLPAEIVQQVSLWTTAGNIARDSVITRADIKQDSRWLERLPTGAIIDPEKIVGMQARQPLQPGEIIKQRQLRKPLLVLKGQRHSAAFQQPGFVLTAEVIALEDGADGDTIKVRNAITEKSLWATVGNNGRLQIN